MCLLAITIAITLAINLVVTLAINLVVALAITITSTMAMVVAIACCLGGGGYFLHPYYCEIDVKANIIQTTEDFPEIPSSIDRLYLDLETTSCHRARTSLNPWHHCWPAGFAFTWDDNPRAYYLPVHHATQDSIEENYDRGMAVAFIQELLNVTSRWINHNIKYDAHVCWRAGIDFDHVELFDTLTQAKLVASDYFNYSEAHLAKKWLEHEDPGYDKRQFSAWLVKNKDWGQVPIRLMGPYACNDVLTNREIYHYIEAYLPKDCYRVSHTEAKVTSALIRAERVGMQVDVNKIKLDQHATLCGMMEIMKSIEAEHGIFMRPSENSDCYEIFHHQYKLPVVRWTGDDPQDSSKGEPSYDKYALATLKKYPEAPVELIGQVLKYRKLSSHQGYLQSLANKQVEGVIHASYNQAVRTGRMSCKEPNNQQWNKPIKKHILAPEGRVFLSFDFSSIEFRLLAHYLGQPEIIQKFVENLDADFHQIVADMCGVARKPAKNINFCMAYGGGKAKVLSMLAADATIIADISADTQQGFVDACTSRANSVFDTYHKMLYKLRPLTRTAAGRLKGRGFVRNRFGRHRHLPAKAAYHALNTVIQSTAADMMKEAVVNTCPSFNEFMQAHGVEQVGFVHDEILFTLPESEAPCTAAELNAAMRCATKACKGLPEKEAVKLFEEITQPSFDTSSEVVQEIVKQMLSPGDEFSVPMRVSGKVCPYNWGEGAEMPKSLLYGVSDD